MRARAVLVPLFFAACAAPRPSQPVNATPPAPLAPRTPKAAIEGATTVIEPVVSLDPRVARLARLARVWGELQYVHPYLWEGRAIDWDAALSAAIPKVSDAQSDDDEVAAISAMLASLHDPITRIETTSEPADVVAAPPAKNTSATWSSTMLLVIKPSSRDWSDIDRNAAELKKDGARGSYS